MIGRHTIWTVRYVKAYLASPSHFLILGTLGNIYCSVSIDARQAQDGKNVFCASVLVQDKLMRMAIDDNLECFRTC